ncbi:MAG: hypothetical protein U5M23_14855 [Marinagarivorans sp.]|nr:hypothetical protein [Marinagarivorans sp.]
MHKQKEIQTSNGKQWAKPEKLKPKVCRTLWTAHGLDQPKQQRNNNGATNNHPVPQQQI